MSSPQTTPKAYFAFVFVCGAAVMLLEFAASRLVAPWFGTSLFVWGNIIGLVLIALSLGYYYGGRLADSRPEAKVLFGITLVAGAYTAVLPLLAQIILQRIALVNTIAQAGIISTIVGSFLAVLLVFAFPIWLLGMISPYVIRLLTLQVDQAGRVAGSLYAWSTIGSIVGTFASAFILVPYCGSRETIFLAAFTLILAALIGLRRARWLWLLLVLPFACYWLSTWQRAQANDSTIIAEVESPYQYIRIQDQGDRLALVYNEGLGTQSYYMKTGVLTGSYYDYMSVAPELSALPDQANVAIIGLAGGTMSRQIQQYYPQYHITGVEIDPIVIQLAQQYFKLNDQKIAIINEDGRMYLQHTNQQFDWIIMDAFTNELYIPWHLTTQEFFTVARNHLTPAGVLTFNLPSADKDAILFNSVVATLQTVFPEVGVVPVPNSFNYVIYASSQPLQPNQVAQRAGGERTLIGEWTTNHYTGVSSSAHLNKLVLTDNRAPIELYTETMVWNYIKSLL